MFNIAKDKTLIIKNKSLSHWQPQLSGRGGPLICQQLEQQSHCENVQYDVLIIAETGNCEPKSSTLPLRTLSKC